MTRASPFKRPAPWAPTTCLVTRICEICLANRGRERATPQILGVGPETVLKSDVLERNLRHQPIQANFDLSSGYGRAFEVSRRDRYTSFGHSGAVAGYEAALYMNREAGLAVIVLANSTGVLDTTTLALRSLDIVSK